MQKRDEPTRSHRPLDPTLAGRSATTWPDHQAVHVLQLVGERAVECADEVIEEIPVALVYNGLSHAVMLVTPTHLKDFALGFSLGEGILNSADDLYNCELIQVSQGIEARITIAEERFTALREQRRSQRRRSLAGTSGCGLCGVESLIALGRPTVPVATTCTPQRGAITRALQELPRHQTLFSRTGGGHAAVWVRADGELQLVREDVGRHNALDKLIGALVQRGFIADGGFAICTSRASYEMVQKSMRAGIGLLVAISAPTAAAIRLAQAAQITLVGFARGDRMQVYSHPQALNTATNGLQNGPLN